ncbi:MAG: HD domain-containing phosphohydrolase [Colwellia sp.]|nr:HD domain-containing phosphohydrolase [Colwellia sp.]
MIKLYTEQTAFQHLLDISVQLSSEANSDILMEKILLAAIDVSHADAGSIYLVNDDNELEFRTIVNKSLGLHFGGSSAEKVTFPTIPLQLDGENNKSAIVAHTANTGEIINVTDVYDEQPFDFSAARKMDNKTGYRTQSMLTFPLQDHTNDIIGVIQLINAIDQNTIIAFSKEIERQILSFASLGAIALTNRSLIHDMEQLFESFAQTIARAIDEKSPHTGGHCKRVPELTLMIADAVHNEQSGPMASFTMSPEERHQLDIAGWLHDCGKIATPDSVMEKEKKLQTIFDRIHYIDAKLEIAARDIKIKYQAEIIKALEVGYSIGVIQLARVQEVAEKQINLDRAFLQKINVGGEFLTDEQLANIHEISRRYSIVIDGVQQRLLTNDEINNLSIKRGTLNKDERLIIQQHMNVTQNILEALPFPKHLSNITEYALGHHETLDGKGYPRGLTKEQMSVPARVMAIADIFEALSSADRPYKQAKPVSECLKIMGRLVMNNHLDGDLFTIFVKAKVYENYIKKFANPAQLDEFELESIPGIQHYN